MAYATNEERLALAHSGDFPCLMTVQIIARDNRHVELAADDIDHALAISADWLRRGALRAEVMRVDPATGEAKPTIGAAWALEGLA